MRGVLAALIAMAAVAPVPSAAQVHRSRDRSCVKGLLDRYMEALAPRVPSRLPLAGTVKFTKNRRRLDPGQGMGSGWSTGKRPCRITRAGSRQTIIDVE
jgi:hypothetical protein